MLKPTDADPEPDLVAAFQQGDSLAAEQIHDRYAERLLALVRKRLNPAFQQRMDPEDVVQSAFRSFFRVIADDSRHTDHEIDAVWRLLASIAVNKLRARIRFHSADKRSVKREDLFVACADPSAVPETEVIFVDELRRVLNGGTAKHRRILELLLNGNSVDQVTGEVGCSVRTVNRAIERAIKDLRERLAE